MNEYTKRYYFCLSSFHAERGAFAIGIVGCVLSTLSIIFALIRLNVFDVFSGILGILVCAAIFYAQRKQNPVFYIPFILCTAITTFGLILLTILFVVFAIIAPKTVLSTVKNNGINDGTPSATEKIHDDDETGARIFAICIAIILGLMSVLHAWFLWIVIRAREYMLKSLFPTQSQVHPQPQTLYHMQLQ